MNKRYALIQRTRIIIDIPGAMSPTAIEQQSHFYNHGHTKLRTRIHTIVCLLITSLSSYNYHYE